MIIFLLLTIGFIYVVDDGCFSNGNNKLNVNFSFINLLNQVFLNISMLGIHEKTNRYINKPAKLFNFVHFKNGFFFINLKC
jgi:hypothetical protein